MTKNLGWISGVLGGAAVLLSACGGGGGGGGGFDGPPTTPVPLATKADALREMGLVLGEGPIADFVELPSAAARLSKRAKAKAKAATTEQCDSGSYTYEESTKTRDFLLLHPEIAAEDVSVSFERGTASNCRYIYSESSFEAVEIYDGTYEEGSTGELGDGSVYQYEILGSGNTPLIERYQERINGQLTYEYEDKYLGTTELYHRVGVFAVGVLGLFSYYEKEGSFSFEASVAMGEGTTPFRAAVGESGEWAQLDGSYAYATSAGVCKGGKLKVTTPSEGGLAFANSRPTSGELRLESGTTTASYTFSNNGGATLVINGGAGIALSPEEVLAAISEDQCVN